MLNNHKPQTTARADWRRVMAMAANLDGALLMD